MRISDWSSDVFSSDLRQSFERLPYLLPLVPQPLIVQPEQRDCVGDLFGRNTGGTAGRRIRLDAPIRPNDINGRRGRKTARVGHVRACELILRLTATEILLNRFQVSCRVGNKGARKSTRLN